MNEPLAEFKSLSKSYGAVKANHNVNFSLKKGTIHALVGENGAGKSTAMKMLFGLTRPDKGQMLYEGKVIFNEGKGVWNPNLAFKHGIGMVHQHFMLASNETVLDNLVLGVENTFFGIRKRDEERKRLNKLMEDTGLRVPLDVKVDSLSVGLQSRCEILKVLYRNANFLILDEPTAVLTPHEVEDFLVTLRKLRELGKTILIVTHKLQEVMAVTDEVTILRSGTTVAFRKTSDTSVSELSELMVGRKLALPKVTQIKNSHQLAAFDFNDSKLQLNSGEILGIAGVEGNGQEELIHKIIGEYFEKKMSPNIFLSVIPSDRHHEGLVLDFPLYENLRLSRRFHPSVHNFSKFTKATSHETELLKKYDVRPFDTNILARNLSGGNQQKLIAARELSDLPVSKDLSSTVVLAVHPTRGVDLGAIEFIHTKLIEVANQGAAVLLVSSELEELMSLSHRIGVIVKQNITKWFSLPYDEKQIGLEMLGGEKK